MQVFLKYFIFHFLNYLVISTKHVIERLPLGIFVIDAIKSDLLVVEFYPFHGFVELNRHCNKKCIKASSQNH